MVETNSGKRLIFSAIMFPSSSSPSLVGFGSDQRGRGIGRRWRDMGVRTVAGGGARTVGVAIVDLRLDGACCR